MPKDVREIEKETTKVGVYTTKVDKIVGLTNLLKEKRGNNQN